MRVAALIAMAILLAATHGFAFDAAEVDIIGLRLGMAETAVMAALRVQGYAVTHDHGALLAKTLDGQLTVAIGPDHAAHEIRYTLRGAAVREADKIQASVVDRFGPPNQSNPMGWCRAIRRDGRCPPGAPSLTFSLETLTLLLRAGTPEGE